MATLLLFSQTVSDTYKEVSELVTTVHSTKKRPKKKNMKELMEESFFHGASWIGYNFIA